MIQFILIYTITFAIVCSAGLFPDFYQNNLLRSENENSVYFDNKHTVCRTKECFRVAAELWESVNKSVDPCEDFYEYACGTWTINNPIPSDKAYWDSRTKTEMKIENRIKVLLEERIKHDDILPVKQLKKFYRSCMNIDALEIMGIKRLQAILTNNGGWPMAMELSEWDPQEFPWQQIDRNYLKLSSSSPFYELRVTQDTRNFDFLDYVLEGRITNNVTMILELSSPSLPKILPTKSQKKINRTMLYESGQYAKLMSEVALMFAKERDTIVEKNQLATDVENIIKLEKMIDKELDKLDYDSNVVTIKELQKMYDDVSTSKSSKINWISMITDYFADANVEMNENEEIEINYSNLLSAIAKILEKTEPRIIVNYIHWYFLKQFLPFTTQHMRMLEFNLYKEMTGVKEETPRNEECVKEIGMEHAKSYQFVKKYFTDDMNEHAQEMFQGIQKAMAKHILKADWLDDEMRKSVLEKINTMKTRIGYPNFYNNATAMENYYRGMSIGNQFLENIFSSLKFDQKKKLRSIRNPVKNDEEWGADDTLQVNAFYNYLSNSLSIPAGEFQTSFYSPSLPEIMSYGSIGFTFGHEISHGFDVDGIKFDANGKRIRYSFDARYDYKERANCFIDQYESYYKNKPNDKKSDNSFLRNVWNFFTLQSEWTEDAKRTQAENIADSLGLEIVNDALQDIENEKNSHQFPGFEDLSNEQFFFLTYANVWCSSSRSKYDEFIGDSHSEDKYRVVAVVQNSEEFSKAFKCPQGSAMNPAIKCKIW
ncbi:neprilysin-1-like [Leptopilina boulardi]|uniref:neprilysin-1-like n=1 Tax=Leptopilina boulardi TaxID=63433 RepID=UPI0021F5B74B|nr:neprilysin-1-like [Leptopilina boulardi]